MSLFAVVFVVFCIFFIAYRSYGGLMARLFQLDPNARTPAVEMRDDVDYVPIESKFLLGQHFSAIAAAAPIVGPITAGIMFGWLPALIWIVLGCVLIGAVHDFGALVASIRHKARSIGQIVRENMSHRAYLLFIIFVWITLVYVVIAFTDIVAGSFVGRQTLENGVVVSGGGIAASSLMYLALPVMMGLLLRYTRLSLGKATLIFLPLVGVSIWAGQRIPLDLASLCGISDLQAHKLWDVLLLGYCLVASTIPMWLLLQPRGHLGGYFLYMALAAGLIGIVLGGNMVEHPAFNGWVWTGADGFPWYLFPFVFIVIPCGACSGFHALIASGTTSKQLRCESDAKPVGYGAMILEGAVAVISLSTVMMLTKGQASALMAKPNLVYAQGLGAFLGVLHVPPALGISFGLLAFTTFVYDTLDVSMRLGRYILQEITGWQGRFGRWTATLITAVVPLIFVTRTSLDASGKAIPAWKVFWNLFGAGNQLLAALTLIAITIWLWRSRRVWWAFLVTGLPALFMCAVSMSGLSIFIVRGFFRPSDHSLVIPADPVPWTALVLMALALLLVAEAIAVFLSLRRPPGEGRPASVPEPIE